MNISENTAYYLAFDGGGTKTEMIGFQADGTVLLHILFPGSNPNSVGMEKALSVFEKGIGEAVLKLGLPQTVWIGCAGMGSAENREGALLQLRKRYPEILLDIGSDTENVLASCPGERAIAVVCGTGSVVYVRNQKETHRLGGWGYLFGDEMSGYHLGRDAVRAVLASYEGSGPETILSALLEEKIGGNLWDRIRTLYERSRSRISSLAPCVFEAFRLGDASAIRILEENAKALAIQITGAIQNLQGGYQVTMFGGLCREKEILEKVLKPYLPPETELFFPQLPPVFGACLKALTLGNIPFDCKKVEEKLIGEFGLNK